MLTLVIMASQKSQIMLLQVNHILNSSIMLIDLSNNVIDSITGLNVIANNSITGTKLANATITSADMADESITSVKIVNGTILSVDIADGTITSGKILDDTITHSDIGAGAVRSSEIATDAVDEDEIAAGAVDTGELANNAVTFDKLEIKIRYGQATGVHNGSSITHNLGMTPTSVVVTPEYDSSFGSGNATIHANIISIGSTSFSVALWVEYEGDAGSLTPVLPGNSVDIYWIAIG